MYFSLYIFSFRKPFTKEKRREKKRNDCFQERVVIYPIKTLLEIFGRFDELLVHPEGSCVECL